MSSTQYVKVKKNLLIYYSLPNEKRYNEKSKENLVQNQFEPEKDKLKYLRELSKKTDIKDINLHANEYIRTYVDTMQREFKRTFSRTQQKKISESTNTFIDVVRSRYEKKKGFNQRMITFVTLTIPEDQKHSDKIMVQTLVDFIDHLKKVKNTEIIKKVDTGKELPRLKNYVWRAETTERGNIHFHLLFDAYVNHTTLKRVWNNYLEKLGYKGGENSANIHNLKNINDVGGYVTKYLTKEPLNDEFTKMLKNGDIKRHELNDYHDSMKYRRAILYRSWGCSKVLKKLSAPTWSGSVVHSFNELKNKCAPVELPDDLKDFIKIYKGKIYDLLRSCSKTLKITFKQKFDFLYDWLYNKTETNISYIENTISLWRLPLPSAVLFEAVPVVEKKPKFIIPKLF